MRRKSWLAALLLMCLLPRLAGAQGILHRQGWATYPFAGTLVDHTNHNGADRRIWSPVLGERRDLIVYLPPGFDPHQCYPVMIWLHGIGEDERSFAEDGLRDFDAAMACGKLPPMIIAMPDGSLTGRPNLLVPRPLWLNSNLGPYEDYLVRDIWGFVQSNYPVRPEREAHVLGGFSGGGAAAFRVAIRYREQFGVVFGISGPLNMRWQSCHRRYFANFDPDCWGWRTNLNRGREPVGRFYGGLITVRIRFLLYPLFGRQEESLQQLIENNPIEMLDRYDVRPGELEMFVAYGKRDEFNIDAQVESFIYRARQRGLCMTVACDPRGRHNLVDAQKFLPRIIGWLAPRVAPFSPPACGVGGAAALRGVPPAPAGVAIKPPPAVALPSD